MSRTTTRIFLGLTLLLAIGAAFLSINAAIDGKNEAWATLAAALAVVTSMVSAWGAQRVVELEEDKLMPFPYPQLDVTSRYGLMLLKVTNHGGSAAHHVKIIWDKPLVNSKGVAIKFGPDSESGEIPVLVPGQHVSKIVDGHIEFFGSTHEHTYQGTIEYQDASGTKRRHAFMLDAEAYKGAPLYDEESLKTHYEIQKLPDYLQALNVQIKKIADQLGRERA
jgi:hypothetical protein